MWESFMIKIIWENKMHINLCRRGIVKIKIGIRNLEMSSKMFSMKLIKENQKIKFYDYDINIYNKQI